MIRLGQIKLTSLRWVGPSAIRVQFHSLHEGMRHQVYAGRRLLGETEDVDQRELVVQYRSTSPEMFQVIAVDGDDRGVDHGSKLPLRPYSAVRLAINTVGWPADTAFIDVFRSPTPGAEVDTTQPASRQLYEGEKTYQIELDPLPRTGAYELQIVGRDNRPNGGNLGTPTSVTVPVIAFPKDVQTIGGKRVATEIEDGIVTVTATLPGEG